MRKPSNTCGSKIRYSGFTPPENQLCRLIRNGTDTQGKISIEHEVQRGEYLHKIAIKYKTTIENIKYWNNLNDTNSMQPGQKLVIWVEDK
jgi:membrane-bound lytic murein transglycosylase D